MTLSWQQRDSKWLWLFEAEPTVEIVGRKTRQSMYGCCRKWAWMDLASSVVIGISRAGQTANGKQFSNDI